MRVLVLFIILFAYSNKTQAQRDILETDSLLIWQASRKLSWDDFKGEINDENYINAGAIMKAGIFVVHKYWDGDIPKFQINSYMKKYESWNKVTDSLSLVHEQGHFDIYEVYARKMRKSYDSLNKIKVSNIKTYENIYNKYMKEASKINYLYEESNFSKSIQRNWTDRLAKELEALKDYEYIPKK